MILSDSEIKGEIQRGNILIDPFNPEYLGSNSYDVQLSRTLAVYRDDVLDVRRENPTTEILIPKTGITLQPGELYLGATVEYTETHGIVPMLEGRSSIGRLGINIHATAGVGDAGFCGHWTLEISVIRPVTVYAGIRIGQLLYYTVIGDIHQPYNKKPGAKYHDQPNRPVSSKYFEDVISQKHQLNRKSHG